MSIFELVEICTKVATSCAVLFGSFTAYRGLKTWNRQLVGQANFDLSRRILIAIYGYRDAVQSARNPLVSSAEQNEALEGKTIRPSSIDGQPDGFLLAMQQRWKEIGEKSTEVYSLLLEADATWGNELSILWKKVNEKRVVLYIATQEFLRTKDKKYFETDAYFENQESQDRNIPIIFGTGGEQDEYSKSMQLAFVQVEDYLRNKMAVIHK